MSLSTRKLHLASIQTQSSYYCILPRVLNDGSRRRFALTDLDHTVFHLNAERSSVGNKTSI